MHQRIYDLQKFLNSAHSVYHAVASLAEQLCREGYTQLRETEEWDLQPGGKYYLTRNGSALLAFRIPEGKAEHFLISASHADRPCFKVKEKGVLIRHFDTPRLCRYNRITVGSRQQMELFMKTLKEVLEELL